MADDGGKSSPSDDAAVDDDGCKSSPRMTQWWLTMVAKVALGMTQWLTMDGMCKCDKK